MVACRSSQVSCPLLLVLNLDIEGHPDSHFPNYEHELLYECLRVRCSPTRFVCGVFREREHQRRVHGRTIDGLQQ